MRYTTFRFGETIYLLGELPTGLTGPNTEITIIDLELNATVSLSNTQLTQVTATSFGGSASYFWSSANFAVHSTIPKQYEYVMRDISVTNGTVAKGKFTIGGHPDESSRSRYGDEVHVIAGGTPLTPLATQTVSTTFATSGGGDTMTRTGAWSAQFSVGRRVQISGTASNDGVTTPILSVTGGGTVLNFAPAFGLAHGAAFTPETVSTTVVAKSQVYGLGEGTSENPVADIRDAAQIAFDLGFRRYHFFGGVALDVDFPHDFWEFKGDDQNLDTLNFITGGSNEGSNFSKLAVTGAMNGRMVADNCIIGQGTITGIKGTFTTCAFKDTIVLGGDVLGDNCASRSAIATVINNAGNHSFLMGSVQGVFTVTNMTGGTVGINIQGSILQIAASCTAGTITAIGIGEFIYTAGSGPTFLDFVIRGSQAIQIAASTAARGLVSIGNGTTDQWVERRYQFNSAGLGTDSTVLETYTLWDQDGVAIAGNHLAGNNPLFDPTRLIAERRR